VALFAVREQRFDGARYRRRIEILITRNLPAGRFGLELRYGEDGEVDLAREDAVTVSAWETNRSVRIRARFETPAASPMGQRVTFSWVEPFATGGRGMVAGWQGVARSRSGELRVGVSTFDLPPRSLGYVSRPGIAGYETVSAVSGRGSDLALRARVFLTRRGRLEAYAGMPRTGAPRGYVALRITL